MVGSQGPCTGDAVKNTHLQMEVSLHKWVVGKSVSELVLVLVLNEIPCVGRTSGLHFRVGDNQRTDRQIHRPINT